MSALPDEVNNGPLFFPPLQMRDRQVGKLATPEPTSKEDGEYGTVAFSFR